ncbi:MAG: hypothetical protein LBS96_02015 [Oscillospiraceae bacterium]|jgi:hypothetical protein|nr:hypothetical protein [Oscillospiraceae bacterium]
MAEGKKITPAQLMQLARQLKKTQTTAQEAEKLDQLAQTGLSEEQQEKIHSVMQDKEELNRLLRSPAAQALLQKLGK